MHKLTAALLLSYFAQSAAAAAPSASGGARFEENRGQTDKSVRFVTRAGGRQIFFTERDIVFSPAVGPAVRMSFPGSSKGRWQPVGAASSSISYFLGSDPAKWVRAAPVFDRLIWKGAYPGIDVVFYGREGELEYDLVVAPGADPAAIRLRFDARASIETDGSIEIASAGPPMRQRPPYIYQEDGAGKRRSVEGRFAQTGRETFTLSLGSYEKSRPLIVDPVLYLATYVGGERDDEVVAVAEGAIAGNTRSLSFPGSATSYRTTRDIFLRGTGEPSLNGRTMIGTLIFGGSDDDEVAGLVARNNSTISLYVAGTTRSVDLPVSQSFPYKGGFSDGFVLGFSIPVNGPAAISTGQYLGGSGEDRIHALSGVDFTFAAVGVTDSPDLATGDVPQKNLAGGKDAFYVTGSVGATTYGYLGGSGDDAAYAVAMRTPRIFWVGGETRSADFPFAQPGIAGDSDAFLTEVTLTPSQPTQNAHHRIGGAGEDSIRALSTALPPTGSLQTTITWIGFAGVTSSPDLPVRNAGQPHFGGETDAFAGIWDPAAAAPDGSAMREARARTASHRRR